MGITYTSPYALDDEPPSTNPSTTSASSTEAPIEVASSLGGASSAPGALHGAVGGPTGAPGGGVLGSLRSTAAAPSPSSPTYSSAAFYRPASSSPAAAAASPVYKYAAAPAATVYNNADFDGGGAAGAPAAAAASPVYKYAASDLDGGPYRPVEAGSPAAAAAAPAATSVAAAADRTISWAPQRYEKPAGPATPAKAWPDPIKNPRVEAPLGPLATKPLGAEYRGEDDPAHVNELPKALPLSRTETLALTNTNYGNPERHAVALAAGAGGDRRMVKGDQPVDSSNARRMYAKDEHRMINWAMTPGGELRAADPRAETLASSTPGPAGPQGQRFNHSSLVAGGDVAGAGMMRATGGKVTELSNSSGHYRPDLAMLYQSANVLQQGGVMDERRSTVTTPVLGNGVRMTGAELNAYGPELRAALAEPTEAGREARSAAVEQTIGQRHANAAAVQRELFVKTMDLGDEMDENHSFEGRGTGPG